MYKDLGGPLSTLLQPLGARVATLSTVQQRTTVTQLLPLGDAVRAFLAQRRAHEQSYDAVVVTRFDLYLKTDLHSLLGDATSIDGLRLLWRESGGHWRHHSDSRTSRMTQDGAVHKVRTARPTGAMATRARPTRYWPFRTRTRAAFYRRCATSSSLAQRDTPIGFYAQHGASVCAASPFFEGGPVTVGGGLTADSGVSQSGRRLNPLLLRHKW